MINIIIIIIIFIKKYWVAHSVYIYIYNERDYVRLCFLFVCIYKYVKIKKIIIIYELEKAFIKLIKQINRKHQLLKFIFLSQNKIIIKEFTS